MYEQLGMSVNRNRGFALDLILHFNQGQDKVNQDLRWVPVIHGITKPGFSTQLQRKVSKNDIYIYIFNLT